MIITSNSNYAEKTPDLEIKEILQDGGVLIKPSSRAAAKKFLNPSSHAYLKFVGKKAFYYVLAFFIAVSIAYVFPRLLPDQISRILPAPLDPNDPIYLQQLAELEAYLGLDVPLWESLLNFWGTFFTDFDLGYSISPEKLGISVSDILSYALPYTLSIVIPALIVSFYVGNWLGARIGFSKNWKNTAVFYILVGLQSVPFYWLGLILLDVGIRVDIIDFLPRPEFELVNLFPLIRYSSFPFFALLICTTGGWATGMRAMTLYEMNSSYVLYCEKLGFRRHRLQNIVQRTAILPQFTGLNLRFSEFIGSTLVLEYVFDWPGLGAVSVEAFLNNDYPLIMGTLLITIIIILVGNFIIDIVYGFLDPRIKTGSEG